MNILKTYQGKIEKSTIRNDIVIKNMVFVHSAPH